MAERPVVVAGGAVVVALVLAGAGLIAAALRTPPQVAAVVVEVPPPPAMLAADEAPPADAPPARDVAVPPAPAAPALIPAPAPNPDPDPAAYGGPPERLVVVATGIAWSDDLAAAAAFRLPADVAFALPADLPDSVRRLAAWQAAGRDVLVRFAWAARGGDGEVVGLDAMRETQAAQLEAQWRAHDTAAGGLILEPVAVAALDAVAASLATSTGEPILLGSAEPGPPPVAWRIDPALLGEAGFEARLAAIGDTAVDSSTLVIAIEIYPGVLDRIVAWLDALEATGPSLAPIATLDEEHR